MVTLAIFARSFCHHSIDCVMALGLPSKPPTKPITKPKRQGPFAMTTPHSSRAHSSVVFDGYDRAPARAMLRATGFSDEDFRRAQIGIATTWSMVTPCNMHLDVLGDEAAAGVTAAGGRRCHSRRLQCRTALAWGRRACGTHWSRAK